MHSTNLSSHSWLHGVYGIYRDVPVMSLEDVFHSYRIKKVAQPQRFGNYGQEIESNVVRIKIYVNHR